MEYTVAESDQNSTILLEKGGQVMNVTPLVRNSFPTLKSLPSRGGVGCDFESIKKAREELQKAIAGPPKSPRTEFRLPRDPGLGAGGNGLGYSYAAKYAEGSTDEDPIVTVDWTDPDGNEFTENIHVNDVDPSNATFIEMAALGGHLGVPGLGPLAGTSGSHPYDQRMNFISDFEKSINMANRLGNLAGSQEDSLKLYRYLDFVEKVKETRAKSE